MRKVIFRSIVGLTVGLGLLISVSIHAELRVMALNTEWLWTPHDHKVDGRNHDKADMSPAAYEEELVFYATLIRQHGVRIVAVSEIENALVADDLAARIGKDWRAYFRQGRDTATGQDVAILSNLKYVDGSLTDFDFPAGGVPGVSGQKRLSKVVGARFIDTTLSKGRQVAVITAHFLSKRKANRNNEQDRQRQAHALLKAVEVVKKETSHIIVLGDFNDYIASPTMTILLQTGGLNAVGLSAKESSPAAIGTPVKSLDHILYRGLSWQRSQRLDLKNYSDHYAVFAEFE